MVDDVLVNNEDCERVIRVWRESSENKMSTVIITQLVDCRVCTVGLGSRIMSMIDNSFETILMLILDE